MSGNDATRIYKVVDEFNTGSWKYFVREKLGLGDFQIEEAEKNYHGDIREQRYQMVQTWKRNNGRIATLEKLEELAFGNGPGSSTSKPSTVPKEILHQQEERPANSKANSRPEIDLRNTQRAFSGPLESSSKPNYLPSSGNNTDVTGSVDTLNSTASGVQSDGKKGMLKKVKNKLFKKKTSKPSNSNEGENACARVTSINVVQSSFAEYEASISNDHIYDIKGQKKGLALIVNNSFSGDKDKCRNGSELDAKNMKELWKQMGCGLLRDKVHKEKTAEEMKTLLSEINKKSDYCFLVIVIMTHGGALNNENFFLGSDGKRVTMREVEKIFHNATSKSRHIPKLFILQFCRGGIIDKGVHVDNLNVDNFRSFVEPMDMVETDGSGSGAHLPTTSKIFLAFATTEGFSALRSPSKGSWFINAITNVFMKNAQNTHVADLFVMVNHHMESMSGETQDPKTKKYHYCKAMSKQESSLTKALYLFPGHPK